MENVCTIMGAESPHPDKPIFPEIPDKAPQEMPDKTPQEMPDPKTDPQSFPKKEPDKRKNPVIDPVNPNSPKEPITPQK